MQTKQHCKHTKGAVALTEKTVRAQPSFCYSGNIVCDISGITTKAPCEAAFMGERHVCIEISDFVMRTFILAVSLQM